MTQNTDEIARPNPDATLTSLAYINVTWSEARASYLDNFVPYALESLRLAPAPMTPTEIAKDINERFGLNFPVNVAKALVDRAVRTQKVSRVTRTDKVQLAPGVAESLPDITREQADCARRQKELVTGLVEFASSKFDLEWTETSAEEALVEYIDAHAIPLLASSVRSTRFEDSDSLQGAGFVIATFIGHLAQREARLFDVLDQMIKGSMLASALYVDSTGQVQRKFRRTKLYLDTSICLQALGHEGEDAKAAAREMLSLALREEAELACFRHSVREMRGILDGVKSLLRRSPGAESATRGVAKHFRAMEMTPSDVDLALASLEDDLARLQIRIVSTPDYADALSVDEAALEERLQSTVGYQYQTTLLADLQSLTAIHRLRRGTSGPHLESCRAVFVTDNRKLVQASRLFFDSGKHEFPLAVVSHSLATLLWVKSPNLAPDLPRNRLIADSFAALAPTQAMWIKFSDEVDRLRQRGSFTDEQVAMLRYSYEAEQALMEATLGDPRRLTEVTVRKTLEMARESIERPVAEQRDQALQRAVEAESAEVQARFDAEQNAGEARALAERVTALEQAAERQRNLVRDDIARRATHFAAAARVVAVILILFAAATALDAFNPNLRFTDRLPAPFATIVRVAAGVCFILGLWTLLYGGSINDWINKKRDAAIDRALRRLDDREGPPA